MTLFFPLQLESIQLIEGGIYLSPNNTGLLQAIKILKLDEFGVHISIYSNQYLDFPKDIDEDTLTFGQFDANDETVSVGHLPISYQTFQSYTPLFVQTSTVKEQELDGYNIWLDANGGYF